jgi:hypothetical protein
VRKRERDKKDKEERVNKKKKIEGNRRNARKPPLQALLC